VDMEEGKDTEEVMVVDRGMAEVMVAEEDSAAVGLTHTVDDTFLFNMRPSKA